MFTFGSTILKASPLFHVLDWRLRRQLFPPPVPLVGEFHCFCAPPPILDKLKKGICYYVSSDCSIRRESLFGNVLMKGGDGDVFVFDPAFCEPWVDHRPRWPGIHQHRGKGLAAFLKSIGYIIPLMDAEYANYYTREVMDILIREFKSPGRPPPPERADRHRPSPHPAASVSLKSFVSLVEDHGYAEPGPVRLRCPSPPLSLHPKSPTQ